MFDVKLIRSLTYPLVKNQPKYECRSKHLKNAYMQDIQRSRDL